LHRNIIQINHKTVVLGVICDNSINELAASPVMVEAKCDCFALFVYIMFKGLDYAAILSCCRMFSLLNSRFCDLHGNALRISNNHHSMCRDNIS